MFIQKWNGTEYEDYEVPLDWKIMLFSFNMDEPINCVNCGKQIKYGDGYTSLRYHNNHGMGYMECEDCYEKYYPTYIKERNEGKIN